MTTYYEKFLAREKKRELADSSEEEIKKIEPARRHFIGRDDSIVIQAECIECGTVDIMPIHRIPRRCSVCQRLREYADQMGVLSY